MTSPIKAAEDDAMGGLPPLTALRLALLRIAADIAPRVTAGVKAQDVVERARQLELYVASPASGSEAKAASEPTGPETGAPVMAPDAGPADLRHGKALD